MSRPQRRKIFLALLLALTLFVFGAASASAAIITIDLDTEFSGADEPEGPTPWLTATFDDEVVGGGTVRLTMSASGLVEQEFVDDWLFNLDPSLDPTLLSFSVVGTPGSTPNSISTGVNAFMADGDGNFDIEFDFPPPPGSFAALFTTGEAVVYDITYGGVGFNANSFNTGSFPGGGNGTFDSAAHVQSIDSPAGENAGSGWIGGDAPGEVPEPASLVICSLLFSFGAVGLRYRRSHAA